MKSLLRLTGSLLLFLSFSPTVTAQLTGTLSVPSTAYPTLNSVVTALNTQGVGTGGLTVTLTAGQTAPAGGYVLGSSILNASLSATNPLLINGGGNTITAQTGTGGNDGVFFLGGTDYVTLNNLNVAAAGGANNNQKIEWGIALFKRNSSAPFDGCQHVTVSNCTINMSNVSGGVGIAARHIHASGTTGNNLSTSGATATDANSNNTFKGNTLTGMTIGIQMDGMNVANAWDYNNTVGGTAAADGNTITIGASSSGTEYALDVSYDSVLTVRNNTFQNAAGQTSGYYLFYLGRSEGAHTIVDNTFDMSSATSSGTTYGFYTAGGTSGFNDTEAPFTFSGNELTGTNTVASSTFYGFYINSMNSNLTNISNNNIHDVTWGKSNYTGTFYAMYYNNGSADSLTVTNNTLERVLKNGTTSGSFYAMYFRNTNTAATGGTFTYEYNKIKNIVTNYYLYGHYIQANSTDAQHISSQHNVVDSVYFDGTASSCYFYNYFSSNAKNPEIAYDTLRNIGRGSSARVYMYTYWTNSGENPDIHHNVTDGVDVGTGSFYNYVTSTEKGGAYHDNIVRNVTNSTNTIYGAYFSPQSTLSPFKVYNNLITNLSKTGSSSSSHFGIYCTGSGNMDIYNNTISDLAVNSSYTNTSTGLTGMYITSSGDYNVYHNTIRISTTGSSSSFGATGIYYSSSTSLNLSLRNNLIHLDCTPAGSGTVVAVRRSSGTTGTAPANLSNSTGNNVYYVPNVANAYWYGEGTTTSSIKNEFRLSTDPAINASCSSSYKAFMVPREVNTFVENNLSAVASADGFYAPTGSSYAKKGGVKITGLPAIDSGQLDVLRPSSPDVGAIQFTGIANDAAGPTISYTNKPASSYCVTQPNIVATITDASGVAQGTGVAPRLYYRKTTDANAFGVANTSAGNGWKWVEATSVSGDTYTFSPDYSKLQTTAAFGNTIVYFVIAQDSSTTPNTGYLTAAFPSTYCPAGVALAGAPATAATPASDSYTLLSLPGFVVEANYDSHCLSGASVLSIVPQPNGTSIVWEKSTNGSTFTPIAGATAPTYTTALLTGTTYYRAKLFCGTSTTPLTTTAVDTILIANPSLTSFPATASRCGEGTVNLAATASAGTQVFWYADSASGIPVATGNTFTPYVTDTTKFFVAGSVPKASTETTVYPLVNYSNSNSTSYGVTVRVLTNTDIYNAKVYARGTGTISVGLYDSTGSSLIAAASNIAINGSGSIPGVAQTIPLNFQNVAPGAYVVKLISVTGSPLLHYRYSFSGLVFPETSPSGNFSIINGFGFTTPERYYGFFYEFETSADCISAKAAVKVNVRPAPAIAATSAKQPGLCLGQTDTVSVTTANPNYTFSWSSGQTNSSFTVSPTTDTTYIVTATDQSGTFFNNCVSKDTVNLFVSTPPTAPSISPVASTICGGEVSVLNATPGQLSGGGNAGPYTIGTGTITNTSTGYPSVYGRYYTGARHQMLVRASELAAAGMVAGKIKSLAFDITALNNFDDAEDFTIGLLATTATQVSTSALVNGATQVFTKALEIPTVGWNTYNFTTPFTWDGVSNILVDVSFTNCTSCSGTSFTCSGIGYTQNASQRQSTTPFISTASFRSDGASCNIKTNTSLNSTSSQRPNMRFTAEPPVGVNWTPVAGLYRDTTLNQPLVPVDSTAKVFASPNSTTTYTAVSNYRGCKSGASNTSVVTVTPTPTVTTTVTPSRKVCAGQTSTIAIPAGGAGVTYQWFNGATAIPGATTNTYAAATSGAYTVLATNTASGCSRRSVVENILVSPYPTATVTATTANPTCAPNTVTLGSNTNIKFVYQWQKGGVDIAGAVTPTYVADSTNAYRVVITDTATTCTTTSAPLTATINRINKTVSVSGPTAICAGNTVTLSVPGAPNQTYVWKNGNTVVAGANSNSFVADTTGNFRVVIANGATGCSDSSLSVPVIVGPAPVSAITPAISTFICAGDTVRLATNNSPSLSYTWYRNGAVITGATDSFYKASLAGAYSVRVASDPLCASTTTTATTVNVNPLPAAGVTAAGPTTFCQGNTVTLGANGGSGLTYQWVKDGTTLAGAAGISYVANTTGSYAVRVTDVNGCKKTSAPAAVTVNPLPAAAISTPASTTVCQGDPLVLSANSGTGFSYQWKESNVNVAGAVNATYNVTTSGIYTVRVTNSFGCSDSSSATVATVNPRPSAAVTPGPNAVLCAGSSVVLTGPVPANTYYQWSLNGTPVVGATNYQYSATAGGTYRLRVTNAFTGCKDSSATVVTPVALPVVSILPSPGASSPICSNDSLVLNASAAGSGLTYQWRKNGVAIAGAAAQGSSYQVPGSLGSGSYTVVATNGSGCPGVSPAFSLVVNPAPEAFVTYNAPLEFCRGGAVVLNAQAPGNALVNWVINGVQQPADTIRFKSVINSGTYSIRVAAPGGCIALSNNVTVKVNELPNPVVSRYEDTLFAGGGQYLTYQWYRNNILISGANSSFYKARSNGSYSVRVSDGNGCENVSESFVFGTVSVGGGVARGLIKLYPNPTTGVVHVESSVVVDITVRDATGRVVRVERGATRMDFSDMADGLYLVYLTDATTHQLLLTEKISKVTR